jgi:two-component system response regulator FixJ
MTEALIHVIDDDEAARDSLQFLLVAARLPVKTHDSALEFLKALPSLDVACIITDVRMPDLSGIDLLRHLREMGMAVPVIVITGHADVPLAVGAMKFGAVDFLEKPFDDEILIASVRAALGGREKEAKREAEKKEYRERFEELSSREKDVLQGLIAGKPNKIIAYDLGISPRTVEIYRANVMTKMRAASLSELVRIALVAGLLEVSTG